MHLLCWLSHCYTCTLGRPASASRVLFNYVGGAIAASSTLTGTYTYTSCSRCSLNVVQVRAHGMYAPVSADCMAQSYAIWHWYGKSHAVSHPAFAAPVYIMHHVILHRALIIVYILTAEFCSHNLTSSHA